MSKKAWVLQDNRAGNTTQTIALAEHLQLGYVCKKIQYNSFAKLPSFILGFNLLHVDRSKSNDIDRDPPDVVISAGRRLAIVAYYLKRQKPNLKTIHIMHSFYKEDSFDYLIVPNHDDCLLKANMITITGALNDTKNRIANAKPLQNLFHNVKDFIGVIIGGTTKDHDFTAFDSATLIMRVGSAAKQTKLPLVITFSRRTPVHAKELIKAAFPNSITYDPEEDSHKPNIYYNILKSAKFIICTADSISMCSEVASSGKPLYIYVPELLTLSDKHINFIEQLFSLKIARQLDDNIQIEQYSYTPLNEVARIAEIIRL
jgi:mitochondrial fission protein ELM1